DGAGSDRDTVTACVRPDGYRDAGGDCDDANPAAGPTVTETCDGIDDDCDGHVDESNGTHAYYRDADRDGWGDPARSVELETCMPPLGFVARPGDCNDAADAIHPGAREVCDRIDSDCSLPAALAGGTDSAEDADRDGHAPAMAACSDGF